MLYQLSHVRMPVPSHPGPVRRIAPALRQNCIRSWPNHQLRTEAKAKNPSPERSRPTPFHPLPQVSPPTSAALAPSDSTQLVSRPAPRGPSVFLRRLLPSSSALPAARVYPSPAPRVVRPPRCPCVYPSPDPRVARSHRRPVPPSPCPPVARRPVPVPPVARSPCRPSPGPRAARPVGYAIDRPPSPVLSSPGPHARPADLSATPSTPNATCHLRH
jgi:hypothetical protein